MAHLFVDSTYDLTLGLLNVDFSWAKFATFANQKASEILQLETLHMCSEAGIEVNELKSVICVSGPGFYTGLRLSEGFVDVLKFSGIKGYSLYSYEVLPFLGIKEANWVTKAYRGEYFIHAHRDNVSENILIPSKELKDFVADKSHFYIHSDKAIDDLGRECMPGAVATIDLIEKHPEIFKTIIENNFQRESYYFRAPEDEFRTSV